MPLDFYKYCQKCLFFSFAFLYFDDFKVDTRKLQIEILHYININY